MNYMESICNGLSVGWAEWQQGAEQAEHPEALRRQHCRWHHRWRAQVIEDANPLPIQLNFTFLAFRALFERYGRVVEADVMTDKNFGFVHVDAGMGKN